MSSPFYFQKDGYQLKNKITEDKEYFLYDVDFYNLIEKIITAPNVRDTLEMAVNKLASLYTILVRTIKLKF